MYDHQGRNVSACLLKVPPQTKPTQCKMLDVQWMQSLEIIALCNGISSAQGNWSMHSITLGSWILANVTLPNEPISAFMPKATIPDATVVLTEPVSRNNCMEETTPVTRSSINAEIWSNFPRSVCVQVPVSSKICQIWKNLLYCCQIYGKIYRSFPH